MTKLEASCVKIAASYLAVANTPLYIPARLREDSSIVQLGKSIESADLLWKLKKSLLVSPRSLASEARPYVYLVAIASQNNYPVLQQAVSLSSPNHRWYRQIADFLNAVAKPTTIQVSRITDIKSTTTTGDASFNNVEFGKL